MEAHSAYMGVVRKLEKMKPILIIATIFLTLVSQNEVRACVCFGNLDSVRTSFKYADLTLKGKIISSEIVGKQMEGTFEVDERGDTIIKVTADKNAYQIYRISVEVYYKGSLSNDTIEIRGPVYSSCVPRLETGSLYFIFARKMDGDIYYTDYCSGNKIFNRYDQKILKRLKE